MSVNIREGWYRGVLLLDEKRGIELPFNFEVREKRKKITFVIYNSDEKIHVEEIEKKGDSLFIKLPVFETEMRLKITKDGLSGYWLNTYRTALNKIPFHAHHGETRRFISSAGVPTPVFEGNWEVTFAPESADSSKALGIFNYQEQTSLLKGTFLTETGDYRYLEGESQGNKIALSAFDGSHAYLFTGELDSVSGVITGIFYSGIHSQKKWVAKKNNDFRLRDPSAITKISSANRPDFSFPDPEGNMVSLSDSQFKDKPVIIQLMGTWCPNCLDESRYFVQLHQKYESEGLKVIGLAFEKTDDKQKIAAQINRYKSKLNINYPILITLKTAKEEASKTFPQLSNVTAFPTTLFLNKEHQIVRVHTGFNGPATGQSYLDFTEETESLIRHLLAE
jgi:thiol-disulfide isomerase/thioredoxin